jgi:PBSX family phage terminase large subunit
MPTFVIKEVSRPTPGAFDPRGAAFQLWKTKTHEVMISGPSETGKTFACLHKLDALLWKYPNSQAVVIRKTLASLYTSVLRTYKNILGPDSPVEFFGGEKPEWADYPNGSRVFFAGMDNPQKALSSERDFIYVNQAEELHLEDWETLTTRCTGRAANAPYAQIIGDCNPGAPTHWILHRPSLKVLESRHEDNPTLFDERGKITPRGQITLSILDRLTGARKDRLRYGRWVQAEGVVYEGWDRAIHLIDRFDIPAGWRRVRSTDFGFTNPYVMQWYAVDPDGRMYLYREIYHTQRTVADHAKQIKELSQGERFEATVADHDAEDRATLHQNGIMTIPAHKAITPGIQAVAERLRIAGDGKPRLYIFNDALVERDPALVESKKPCCTAEEFDAYSWPKGQDGKAVKEVPVDKDNHGMDAMRYEVAYLDHLASGPPIPPRVGGSRSTPTVFVPGQDSFGSVPLHLQADPANAVVRQQQAGAMQMPATGTTRQPRRVVID